MICERCGADAIGVDGVCQECGWRRGMSRTDDYGSSPSLAQTRAADIPPLARPAPNAPRTAPGAPFLSQRGPSATSARPFDRLNSTFLGGMSTSQFCGSCGARIEPGQQFCGQCGAASSFGVSSPEHGTELQRTRFTPGPSGSMSGAWSTDEYDAPTEAFSDAFPSVAPGYSSAGPRSYGDQPRGMSRELRIIFGILCILGGLVSGAAAIILALANAPH
jgi:hypothetical protein